MNVLNIVEPIWIAYQKRRSFSLLSLCTPAFWFMSLFVALQTKRARAISREHKRPSGWNAPVISIGNISVGGSGKTPLTAALAQEALRHGLRVGIATSGYGRESETLISGTGEEMQRHDATQIGDETRLLAVMLPSAYFAVATRKVDAVEHLQREGKCDWIVVDDAFQHWPLVRDIDIVTIDATITSAQWRVFPYGMLRESKSALRDADIIITTRTNLKSAAFDVHKEIQGLLKPDSSHFKAEFLSGDLIAKDRKFTLEYLRDKRVFLFAGIASFANFEKQVAALAGELVGSRQFSDHRRYDFNTIQSINQAAQMTGADVLLTTMKDWVKLDTTQFAPECLAITLQLEVEPSIEQLFDSIQQRLLKSEIAGSNG